MNKGNVIIVEDDPDLLENLVEFLMLEGFNVQGVSCVLDFFQTLSISDFDIAIVDIGLPDKSGFEVVKHLRDNTNMGIIILTARDSINDKMMGYDAGTDYYFVKPVEIRELVAAIHNLFVRLKKDSGTQVSKKLSKKWTLDNQNWKLISPFRHETNLTTKELSFLQLLVSEKGNPVSRNKLLTSLGYHSDGPYGNRALDVMIVRLRKKIKSNIREEVPIRTVHSVGFCFSAPAKQI